MGVGARHQVDHPSQRLAALAFANTPGPAAAQQPLPPVHVVVLDSAGFVDSSASLTVSVLLQTYSGTATLGGTTTAQVNRGSVDFTDLTISAPGSYILVAFTPGLGAGRSAPFAITAPAHVR